MGAITGYSGSVSFGGGAVAIVKSFEIEETIDIEDTTPMAAGADGWKTKQGTLSEWKGTFEGQIDSADAKFRGVSPVLRRGATGAASFVAGSLGTYSGNIIITSLKRSVPVGSVITFTATFEGNGPLTYPV